MRRIVFIAFTALLFLLPVAEAGAAFSSIYVFGDGVSTMTNSPGAPAYYGKRYSNGWVWVEVLAQRQGLVMETNRNWSFFGHYSSNLVINVSNFAAPTDVATALFVVWINNADFVGFLNNPFFAPYASNNIAIWTNAINQSLSNHSAAVQALYAKGARTLVMPYAVDLTKVPFYNLGSANVPFVRQRIADFNSAFTNRLAQLRISLTGLNIVTPDTFTLFDDLLARPGVYGFTNTTGYAIDAGLTVFAGPGTNYIFWDYLHPTAKVHEIIADQTHQLLTPTRLGCYAAPGGSNAITVVNLPIGLSCFVESSSNSLNWSVMQSVVSTNSTGTILVPATGERGFHRLRFPFSWSWP